MKTIRLTESDLNKIVKRVINEQGYDLVDHDFRKIINGLYQAKEAIDNKDIETASHIIEVLTYTVKNLHQEVKK